MAGLAQWCFRHRYVVIALWIVALAILGGVEKGVGTAYSNNFSLPGTESKTALELLQKSFPAQAGESDTIVWHVTDGKVTDPAVQQRDRAMLGRWPRSRWSPAWSARTATARRRADQPGRQDRVRHGELDQPAATRCRWPTCRP